MIYGSFIYFNDNPASAGPNPAPLPQVPVGNNVGNNGDTTSQDTTRQQADDELRYPISDDDDPYSSGKRHPFELDRPESIERSMELDSSLKNYKIKRSIGGVQIGETKTMPVDEYLEEDTERWQQEYFKQRSQEQNFVQGNSLIPEIDLGENLIDQLLSGGVIDIKPRGSAELIFKGDFNRVENPAWDIRQQRTGQFKFDQKINLNVTGTIADRIDLGINYDTESQFQFDNKINIDYQGDEDEIVQNIELGNVDFPVPGTLIDGSRSLFGVKTKLQFGRLTMTSVLSQKRSEKKTLTIQGGGQREEFEIEASNYDANRHFFLAQYFRNHFNESMSRLPIISSQVVIKKVEIWVTNQQGEKRNTRDVVGFMDLGEPNPYNARHGTFINGSNQTYPDNGANTLYQTLTSRSCYRDQRRVSRCLQRVNDPSFSNGEDYIKIDNARQLENNEYTLHPKLGYVSLNRELEEDEVLAVAFEYTVNGKRYQVGEFARNNNSNPTDPKVLFLKLLKGYGPNTDLPMWDLMMKNIYAIGGFQINQENFRLQVIYEDDKSGADLNYIPEPGQPELARKPLLQVLGMDQLNSQQEAHPDGRFDFIQNVTIMPSNGRVVFPVVEPFGKGLRRKFQDPDSRLADQYAFDALYDSTKFLAEQAAEQNKFYLSGHYQSSSGKSISLNAINIPKNSVKVTAGGVELQEGVDYTVDYTLGRVRIINEQILNSGQVIKVSAESNQVFSSQKKTFIGNRFDYKVSENFDLGGTFLYQRETPITKKTNIGNEPVANAIWGVDGSYQTDSRFLTQLVDGIPFIETKEKSSISVSGEFAHLIPGHPNTLGPKGTSYLDDFEGSETTIDLRVVRNWQLSSTPAKQPNLIPNGGKVNDISYNYQRAKIAWYQIDNLFFQNNQYTPDHIQRDQQMQSNHYMRRVRQREVFPNRQNPSGVPNTLNTFDIAYFPNKRGPYNYNAEAVQPNGELRNPEDKWGGIMRALQQTDFQANNIEYIEFWMMDPFIYRQNHSGGDLYINLGNISEDILKDGLKMYENGMPADGSLGEQVTETVWGYVPVSSPVNFAFANDPEARPNQDIGLDGLTDERERQKFDTAFLDKLRQQYGENSQAYQQALADPSADNYQFYRGDEHNEEQNNIIERYMDYNNTHGNSPTPEQWPNDYSNSAALKPDVEDINNDFTLNEQEDYFQYKINLEPGQMNVGQNYIANKHTQPVTLKNDETVNVTWYQFKIPVRSYDKKVGDISNFTSIRFMRMFFTNFTDSIICRFGQMNLVRGEYRKYLDDPKDVGPEVPADPIDSASFDISTVNIEENGRRQPIPYVLPPGIEREVEYSTTELLQQNEQSMALDIQNLPDGGSRAAFKRTSYDVRKYKRLKMYVHAEGGALRDGDLWLFIRLGSDFSENFYEYAIPLKVTNPGTSDPNQIWPDANQINIALDQFTQTKLDRDRSGRSLQIPYTVNAANSNGKITVMGNPDLSEVESLMIGVWNPKAGESRPDDNGRDLSGHVWVNELRVSDFDNEGGWAARAQVKTKLADFGEMTLAGNRRTIGFGGIEESVQERSMEDIRGFDFKSSFNLGKFFPESYGVKIPMFYSHSETIARPQYNPLNQDILLETRMEMAQSEEERDSIRRRVEDYTMRRSLNFTNVRKARTGNDQNTSFTDIENFSLTYSYQETYRRNIDLAFDEDEIYNGILNYNYSFQPNTIRPFRNLSNSKYLRPITDFNFNFIPSSIGFRTEVRRRINKFQYRSNTADKAIIPTNYDKNFSMKRVYNLRWNLTNSLRLNYSATMDAAIDEPYGEVDQEARDSIRENLLKLGRPERFQQRINLTYDVPLQKFPFMDWTSLQTSYDGSYRWETAPPAVKNFGNTINNSQDIQLNGQLQLRTLYNKVPFFRTINRGGDNVERIKKKKLDEKIQEWRELKNQPDTSAGEKPTMADVEVNEGLINLAETVSRGLMSVRNVNLNYSLTRGTGLHGFMPKPDYFGRDFGANAPSFPFVFGRQTDIQRRAIEEGWLTKDTALNEPFTQSVQRNLTGQALVEPIDGLRINVDFSRRITRNQRKTLRYFPQRGMFDTANSWSTGSYSISYFTLPTAFIGENDDGTSPVFTQFENNRKDIAKRLSESGIIDPVTEYPKGYTPSSQQVLIPAFLAAYSGRDASKIGLSPFPDVPMPNWRLTYNGLSKLDIFEDLINNISLTHGYRSTYSVSNFQSNLQYNPNAKASELDDGTDFHPQYQIDRIQITESLSPLIGLDISWENDWTSRLEYSKSRRLSFRLTNNRLTEVTTNSVTVGVGYRTQQLTLPFRINGQEMVLDNELNFRFDFQIRDNKTTVRRLDKETPEPISGQTNIEIKPNIDYVINENLNLRIFFNRTITNPVTTNSYPRKNTNFGFSLRYTLGG